MHNVALVAVLTSATSAVVWPSPDLNRFVAQTPGAVHVEQQADAASTQVVSQESEVSLADAAALPAVALPGRKALISAPIAETIQDIFVTEGQFVEPGDLLLKFSSELAQAELNEAEARARSTGAFEQARARLRFAEINESTLREARQSKAAGEMELLRATSEREQAHAAHLEAAEQRDLARLEADRLRAQLTRYTPTAPFAGVIARIHAETGETPGAAAPLLEIVSLSTLRVEMHLKASYMDQLEVGQQYMLSAAAPVDREIQATLVAAPGIIDPASRTVRCVFEIENTDRELPSGFHVSLLSRAPRENTANEPAIANITPD